MKTIIKEPGFPLELIDIPNELKALQQMVGGYIETVTIARDLVVICNEEGRLNGLPPNCSVCGVDFVGPILICSRTRDGEFADIKSPTHIMQLIRERNGLQDSLLGLIG